LTLDSCPRDTLTSFAVYETGSKNRQSCSGIHLLNGLLTARQARIRASPVTIPDVFSGKRLEHAEYASGSLLALTRDNVKGSKLDEAGLWFFGRMASQPSYHSRPAFPRQPLSGGL
jgi:hypothetical protein